MLEKIRAKLTAERDHRARRVERIRLLATRPDGLSDSNQAELEYNDGVRFGLDLALAELRPDTHPDGAPRGDYVGITFAGEASETFAERVSNMRGWYVELTLLDGSRLDVVLDGAEPSALDTGWYDAVRFVPADPVTGEPIPGAVPDTARVSNVHVY
jgi:hypothetical protein